MSAVVTTAKFRCNLVSKVNTADGWQGTKVSLNPVGPSYEGGNPVWPANSDNEKFWDASPSGELNLWIKNPAAAAVFVEGKEYYIDFRPAS
jgi:hypothetical protein